MNSGLDDAVSLQGGSDYLRNINIGSSKPFELEIVCSPNIRWQIPSEIEDAGRKEIYYPIIKTATYNLAVNFKKKGKGIKDVHDSLTLLCDFYKYEPRKKKDEKGAPKKERVFSGLVILASARRTKRTQILVDCPEFPALKPESLCPGHFRKIIDELKDEEDLPLTAYMHFLGLREHFGGTAIFDIDPKLSKKGVQITGKIYLEEDGSNLAPVLRKILTNPGDKKKFFSLVGDLLPFISEFKTESNADKSLVYKLKERYNNNKYLYSSFLSDGTINIASIILALFFDKRVHIIVEEPERNIHPYLIEKVVDMMRDASQQKQIIVTTHNSVLLRHSKIEEVLLMSRDDAGFSRLTRPSEKEDLVKLLNEIGIDELLVQNLLETLS